jgi:integrase/recombinase XerD
MHLVSVRIPGDIPPALHSLIELFCLDALRVRCVADETANAEIIYIARFFRHFGLPDSCEELFLAVSPNSISAFLIEYAANNSAGSVRWMKVSLRSFLHFAYRSSLIERDLARLVSVQSIRRLGIVPRSLPDECIARLRCGIDRSTADGMRDSAIICLLATYGVRGIQIRRLRLDAIDWRNERIHFPAAKGGRPIEQHLIAEAGNLLSKYIQHDRPKSDHPEVFLTLHEPFDPLPCASYLSDMIKRRIKQLGLALPDGVSHGTHGFRHAFASRMVGKVPFKDLVDQLGHRDPASTLIYSKVDLDGLHQAALPWPGGEQ